MNRDPALLPGPTAAQWDLYARLCSLVGSVLLLGAAVLFAAGVPWHPAVFIVLGSLGLVGYVGWFVLGARSQRQVRRETAAGYSTTLDAAGFDLRHPVSGALERSAAEPPSGLGRRRSFLLDNLRIRPGTWVDRQRGTDES